MFPDATFLGDVRRVAGAVLIDVSQNAVVSLLAGFTWCVVILVDIGRVAITILGDDGIEVLRTIHVERLGHIGRAHAILQDGRA